MMIGSSLPILKALYVHIFHPPLQTNLSTSSKDIAELESTHPSPTPEPDSAPAHRHSYPRSSLTSTAPSRFSLPYPFLPLSRRGSKATFTTLDTISANPDGVASTSSLCPGKGISVVVSDKPEKHTKHVRKKSVPSRSSSRNSRVDTSGLVCSPPPQRPPPAVPREVPKRKPQPIQTFDPDFFAPTPPGSPKPEEDKREEEGKKEDEPFKFSATSPLPRLDEEEGVVDGNSTSSSAVRGGVPRMFSSGGTEPLPPQ
jgi:hypothetical protein